MTICFFSGNEKNMFVKPHFNLKAPKLRPARDMTTAALCFASASGDVAEADLEIRETMIRINMNQ